MKKLWAPWRMQYVQKIDNPGDEGCIFCEKPKQLEDKQNLILHRGRKNFIILNLYPYNNGHLMVVPYEHTDNCGTLDDETAQELWQLVNTSKHALEQAFHPEGFNIGMNVGRIAGAGIYQHIHMHIVPRWNGDTNFMPVVADTKVISQALSDTYDALKPYFDSSAGAKG